MAQGFKTKLPQPKKQRSSVSVNKTAGKTKKGARTIPPKRQELVQAAAQRRSASSAHGLHFEETAAAKAASKGKLTAIMKDASQRGDATAKR
ncbi:MAG: hypothetical protein CYPHOPRED_000207 [Cyphobasidiales sp. Tagirdzhanova-0007]|nr:MAG: hypothetical protein CYPHOPRED_000207 [Cyphobasidiales sp. Tagirdzhanova-0007]